MMHDNDKILGPFKVCLVIVGFIILLLFALSLWAQSPLEVYAEDFGKNPTGFIYDYIRAVRLQSAPDKVKLDAIERFAKYLDEDAQPGSIWNKLNDQEKRIALMVSENRMKRTRDAYDDLKAEAESRRLTLREAIDTTYTIGLEGVGR